MSVLLQLVRCASAVAIAATMLTVVATPARAAETITVSGTVLDRRGDPVAGAEIWDGARNGFLTLDGAFYSYCADAGERGDDEPLATTDPAGYFAFSCAFPAPDADGNYGYLNVYATDPAGRFVNAQESFDDPGTYANVVLRLGLRVTESVSARGVVLDPEGVPLAGAQIWDWYDGKGDRGLCAAVGRIDVPRAVSAADGTFEFECRSSDAVRLVATMPGRDFVPQAGAHWFTGDNVGATFRFFRERGVATGRVLDVSGTPVPGLDVFLFGDCYVYCGETTTDAAGRYRFDALVPWTRYRIEYSSADLDDYDFMATEGTLTVPDRRMDDRAPAGAFTWSRNAGRLVVGGFAEDDVGIAKVRVAVRNLGSGKWLRTGGGWGAFDLLAAEVVDPGARRTDWRFKRNLPPGRYGVSLVAVDTIGQRNPQPRPWDVVKVRRG